MSVVTPREGAALFVPVELDGERGRAVFEAAHVDRRARIFWHLDDELVAETRGLHQVGLAPKAGLHLLTLVDDRGNRYERRFRVWSDSAP
jgi:penicillin-binding protein 1C